jgi:hypothetical protein
MAKYIPKLAEIVLMDAKRSRRYLVVNVNHIKETVDLRGVSSIFRLIHDVPWTKIRPFNETENAVR